MLSNIVKKFLLNKDLLLGDKDKVLDNKEINLKLKYIIEMIDNIDDDIIGVMLPRNIDYILVILAIWKSGKAFVPLNDDWPKIHKNLIIKRSNINYLITENKSSQIRGIKTIYLGKKDKKTKKKQKKNNKIAYIIFTSGSTGEPKGVQISNRAFVTYLNWVKKNQSTKRKINHLITGEITFDIILADLAFSLANKASIFITDNPKNIFSALELIKKNKINSIYCVPSLIDKIIDGAKALSIKPIKFEFVFCGGDVFKVKLYKKIKTFFKKAKIYNMYGPTECSMNSLGIELNKFKNILKLKDLPTGYQFKHLNYLILNEKKKRDEQGELYIGGDQLMDGYLTKEKNKLTIPFVKINNKWFYKTGDIFRKNKNLLHFVGRKNQINKISGFRLNFSYIENSVEQLNFIKEFKLYIKDENLYGFYTRTKNINSQILKNFFQKKFPNYMIPKKIINIKKFPYNERGKINFNILIKKI